MQLYNWDQAGFEQAYLRSHYKPKGCGVNLIHSCRCITKEITYSREFFTSNTMFEIRAKNIVKEINLPKNSSVLVVGCALGFIMVELAGLHMHPIGIDNSQFVQSMKNRPNEKINFDIFDIDITSRNFLQDMNRLVKNTQFDCIVTEDVLPSYSDFSLIFENCEKVLKPGSNKSNIVHLVNTKISEAPFIPRTLNEWKNLNPEHTWLNDLGEKE